MTQEQEFLKLIRLFSDSNCLRDLWESMDAVLNMLSPVHDVFNGRIMTFSQYFMKITDLVSQKRDFLQILRELDTAGETQRYVLFVDARGWLSCFVPCSRKKQGKAHELI
jgi:hypothetical protein